MVRMSQFYSPLSVEFDSWWCAALSSTVPRGQISLVRGYVNRLISVSRLGRSLATYLDTYFDRRMSAQNADFMWEAIKLPYRGWVSWRGTSTKISCKCLIFCGILSFHTTHCTFSCLWTGHWRQERVTTRLRGKWNSILRNSPVLFSAIVGEVRKTFWTIMFRELDVKYIVYYLKNSIRH